MAEPTTAGARAAFLPRLRPLAEILGRTRANVNAAPPDYCNFAYSAFACFRMGMSGSASFQRVRKSSYALLALAVSPDIA